MFVHARSRCFSFGLPRDILRMAATCAPTFVLVMMPCHGEELKWKRIIGGEKKGPHKCTLQAALPHSPLDGKLRGRQKNRETVSMTFNLVAGGAGKDGGEAQNRVTVSKA